MNRDEDEDEDNDDDGGGGGGGGGGDGDDGGDMIDTIIERMPAKMRSEICIQASYLSAGQWSGGNKPENGRMPQPHSAAPVTAGHRSQVKVNRIMSCKS